LSLAPTGLPRFRHGMDSFIAMLSFYPSGIAIMDGAFITRMWDLTTFSLLVKTCDN